MEAKTDIVMTISMAEKTGNTISMGNNKAQSDRGSREDEYSDNKTPVARGKVSSKEPIYHGCG